MFEDANARAGHGIGANVPVFSPASMLIKQPRHPRWRLTAILIALWALVVADLVLGLFPGLPKTLGGWVLLFVFGPPVYLALQWVADRLFK